VALAAAGILLLSNFGGGDLEGVDNVGASVGRAVTGDRIVALAVSPWKEGDGESVIAVRVERDGPAGSQASGRGCGQRLFQCAHRLGQLGAAHPQHLNRLIIRG
jgi:hypothetical protein